MLNKFLCFNLSQVFKVISSNLYSKGDTVYLFKNLMNDNQIKAAEEAKNFIDFKLIDSRDVLPISNGIFGTFFYTYLMKISFFKKLNDFFYEKIINELGLSKSKIFLFHTIPPVASVLLSSRKVSLIEDGLLNYGHAKFSKGHEIIRILFRQSKEYRLGCEKNITNIYLKNPHSKDLLLIQREKAKHLILNYQSLHLEYLKNCLAYYNESIIILTQPLSEKGYCSFNEKGYLYQKLTDYLTEKFPSKKKYLKLHPLEDNSKNYNSYMKISGVDGILNSDFPSEVLEMFLTNVIFYSYFSSSDLENSYTILHDNYQVGIKNIIENKIFLEK